MLLIHSKKHPRSTRQSGKTDTNREASDGQKNDRVGLTQLTITSTTLPTLSPKKSFVKIQLEKNIYPVDRMGKLKIFSVYILSQKKSSVLSIRMS